MSVFKCKMCGGTIEFNAGDTVGACEYCGSKQTLPRLDSDRKMNLYDRANHFRRNNEFDKAMSIYENILNEDPTDAEAYWSLVLCRYGIEYVEDPASHKRLPTVNRAQFTSIFDDEDYKSALQYADALQRTVYEDEAKAINEIQKGILEISAKEEPFDVFICYKETDANGRRTPDSVLATDLYHQLTNEGFKVFFSRITLEDKLGTAYEPYIFAALHSAKAMVVLGTKPEYFNAVWVKNEWSRYLALIKAGAKKTLIPAYRDMDPYDLPDEFSHLQAQDMSKLGFMQDLIRGIKKLVQKDEPKPVVKETVVTAAPSASTAPLLRRAFMFLEDGEWQSADEYCEKVLDAEPENAEAYLGKLMAELKVRTREGLKDVALPFDDRNNCQKAARFGDDGLKKKLADCNSYIRERNETARKEGIYQKASRALLQAQYDDAIAGFASVIAYKDAKKRKAEAEQRKEEARKDEIYQKASDSAKKETVVAQTLALHDFQSIPGWKDADMRAAACEKKIQELRDKAEAERIETERKAEEDRIMAERKAEEDRIAAERKAEEFRVIEEKSKKKRILISAIVILFVIAVIATITLYITVILPKQKKEKAEAFLANKDYSNAYKLLEEIGASDVIDSNKYERAIEKIEEESYEDAIDLLNQINYKDSKEQLAICYIGLYGEETYNLIKNAKVGDIIQFGSYEQDGNTANGKEKVDWIVLEKNSLAIFVIAKNALDCQQYNAKHEDTTWENCTLRDWLNNSFLNTAFSTNERRLIPSVTVTADKSEFGNANPGKNTRDQVFLLSGRDTHKYFTSNNDLKCEATVYAIEQGAYVKDDYCTWWLRSLGFDQNTAGYVGTDGDNRNAGFVDNGGNAIRPVMWIDLRARD